jgi:hypothetical protein
LASTAAASLAVTTPGWTTAYMSASLISRMDFIPLVTITTPPGRGHRAAAQVGAGAPHGQRQAVIVAQTHGLCQGLARGGPHDEPGLDRIDDGGVVGVGVQIGFIGPRVISPTMVLN